MRTSTVESEDRVVTGVPRPAGPLLYGTVLNSADEQRARIDWRAFGETRASDTDEPTAGFRDVPFGRECITVFTTQFRLGAPGDPGPHPVPV